VYNTTDIAEYAADSLQAVVALLYNEQLQSGSVSEACKRFMARPAELFLLHYTTITRLMEHMPGAAFCARYKFRHITRLESFKYCLEGWQALDEADYEAKLGHVDYQNPTRQLNLCARTRIWRKRPPKLIQTTTSGIRKSKGSKLRRERVTARSTFQLDTNSDENNAGTYKTAFLYPNTMLYRQLKLNERTHARIGQSGIEGKGLYALRTFSPGDMVLEYVGEIVGQAVADAREKLYDEIGSGTYMFYIDYDKIIDATTKGSMARYVNHCCDVSLHLSVCMNNILTLYL